MHFENYPFESSSNDRAGFPHHSAMTSHLLRFADRFGLLQFCNLNSKVSMLGKDDAGKFILEVGGRRLLFDRVCLCTGKANRAAVPHVLADAQTISFHSSELAMRSSTFEGRHVVVVGGGASAVDACELAVRSAVSVTILNEQPLFLVPRVGSDGQPLMDSVKMFHLLLPNAVFDAALRKIVLVFPKGTGVEFDISKTPVPTWRLHDLLAAGQVRIQLGAVSEVRDGKVILGDGNALRADVIVWCTGYHQTIFDILSPDLRAQVLAEVPLFENVWVAGVPGLAVMGQGHGQAFWWILELQGQWIARVWSGRIVIPDQAEIREWSKQVKARQLTKGLLAKRPKHFALAEHGLVSGARLAKHNGSWPGLARVLMRAWATFQPRVLYQQSAL